MISNKTGVILYTVVRGSEVGERPIICGMIKELTTKEDHPDFNISVVDISGETKNHHHNRTTEAYYVLDGSITVLLDNKKKEILNKGDLLVIKPGTKHKAFSNGREARILVVASPAFDINDEIEDE